MLSRFIFKMNKRFEVDQVSPYRENKTVSLNSNTTLTFKFGQGHYNWYEQISFKRGYHQGKLERFRENSVQENTQR